MALDASARDDHQYSVSGVRAYEAIYGRDFVSTGGRQTTAEILSLVEWPANQFVLDVGCGLGGAAFMMATERHANVLAMDMSQNMIDEARRRCEGYGLTDRVTVEHGDILETGIPNNFDLVHSREVFLHIHDKAALFDKLRGTLRPGGRLLFTDYCCGAGERSAGFAAYVEEFGYDLRTVPEIEALLIDAGFSDVVATDQTDRFIEIHERELSDLPATNLTPAEQHELRVGWLAKIDRARAGEQCWGLFQASG